MEVLFFFVGGCFASLLNVICWRSLNGENYVWGKSHCEQCGKNLSILEMIPVVSWIMQNGRCRNCKSRISVLYPLSELFCGIVFVLLMRKGMTDAVPYFLILLLISLYDIRTMEFPELLLYLLIPCGLVFSKDIDVPSRIKGAVIVPLIILIINHIRKGFGEGDILLLVINGFFLGFEKGINAFCYAVWSCALYILFRGKGKGEMLCFCPFIMLGWLISLLL